MSEARLLGEDASWRAIDEAPFGPFQLRVVLLCALVGVLDGFDTQTIAFVAPSIAESWHIPPSAFGPIFGAGLFGLMLGALFLGALADRIGRKYIIIASALLFGLASLATAAATSLDMLFACRFLTGIGLGGAMPNLIALTNEYAPRRLKATLVSIMFCGFPLGSTIGGLVSVPLIERFGWTSVFVTGGLLPLLLAPALVAYLPDSLRFLMLKPGGAARVERILRRINPAAPAAAAPLGASDRAASGDRFWRPVAGLFEAGRTRTTLLLWIAFFMNLFVMYSIVNWLPSLIRGSGLSLRVAVLSTALLHLGGLVGGLAIGRIIDRRDPYPVIALAYMAAGGFIALIAVAGTNVPLLLAAVGMVGVCVVGAQIGLNAATAAYYPTAMRATGVGWALGIGRIGSIIGPVAAGVLLGLGWSARALLLGAVVPALLAATALAALWLTGPSRALRHDPRGISPE